MRSAMVGKCSKAARRRSSASCAAASRGAAAAARAAAARRRVAAGREERADADRGQRQRGEDDGDGHAPEYGRGGGVGSERDSRACPAGRVSDPVPGMRRLVLLLVVLAALPATAAAKVATLPPPVPAGPTEVVPGLTYQRLQQPGPQVVHVLRMQLGAAYLSLNPVLTAGTPAQRGSLTGYMRSTLDAGSVAG